LKGRGYALTQRGPVLDFSTSVVEGAVSKLLWSAMPEVLFTFRAKEGHRLPILDKMSYETVWKEEALIFSFHAITDSGILGVRKGLKGKKDQGFEGVNGV